MITKPKEYEQLKQNHETLTAGGHKCVIMEAKESKDQNGKDILVVYIDTSPEDSQPNFFSSQYKNDTRENKKWSYGGQRTFWKESNYYEKNVSQMCGAIEASNPDVDIWRRDHHSMEYVLDLERLAGLKLGVVFRQEEYEKEGSLRTMVKPMYFCEYSDAENKKVPNKKELPTKPATGAGFISIVDNLDDDGLPFK